MTPKVVAAPGIGVWRPIKGPIKIQLPYDMHNRAFLKRSLDCRPKWDGKWWCVARPHFETICEVLAKRVYRSEVIDDQFVRTGLRVVFDYNERQRCHTACQEAVGNDCVCSCHGLEHGGQPPDHGQWFEIPLSTGVLLDEGHAVRITRIRLPSLSGALTPPD